MPENGNGVSKSETSNNEEFFEKNELKNNKVVPVVLISIFLLMFIVFGGYFYFSKPSRIVINTINTLYEDYFNSILSQNNTREVNSMLVDMNFKFDTNIDGLEDLSSESFGYNLGIDYSKQKMYMDMFWKEDSNTLFGLMYYLINNQTFMKFDGNDKLIEIDTEEVNSAFTLNTSLMNYESTYSVDDIKYVVETLKDYFINSLDMSVLKKSREVIEVNGEERKVTKVSYSLTEENISKIVKNFVKNVNNDSKFLERLSDLYDVDVEDLKAAFEELKNGVFEDAGELNIYVHNITLDPVRIEYVNDEVEFHIDFSNGISEILINSNGMEIIFTVNTANSEEINVDFSITNAGIKGNLIFTAKEESKDKLTGEFKFNIKYFVYDFGINADYTIQYDADIQDIDTTNSVKLSTMDPNEFNEITNRIFENIQNSKLFQLIGSTNQEI